MKSYKQRIGVLSLTALLLAGAAQAATVPSTPKDTVLSTITNFSDKHIIAQVPFADIKTIGANSSAIVNGSRTVVDIAATQSSGNSGKVYFNNYGASGELGTAGTLYTFTLTAGSVASLVLPPDSLTPACAAVLSSVQQSNNVLKSVTTTAHTKFPHVIFEIPHVSGGAQILPVTTGATNIQLILNNSTPQPSKVSCTVSQSN